MSATSNMQDVFGFADRSRWVPGAVFSVDGRHRYALWRPIQHRVRDVVALDDFARVLFLMLNPSTADEFANDPTVARCVDYADRWGFGGLWVANLFSWRGTDPMSLVHALEAGHDPSGGEANEGAIASLANDAKLVICAWGNGPGRRVFERKLEKRARAVVAKLRLAGVPTFCLGEPTGKGHPNHPLYLRRDIERRPFAYAV